MSFQSYNYYDVGATCLWLANKVEEGGKMIVEFSRTCAQKASKREQVSEHEINKWHNTLLVNEAVVAFALGFDLIVEHAYYCLLQFSEQHHWPLQLLRSAWAWINDSYRTPLCLLYSPQTISTTAIFLACNQFPDLATNDQGQPWWELVPSSKVEEAAVLLLDYLDIEQQQR
jgi:hypothetical protein